MINRFNRIIAAARDDGAPGENQSATPRRVPPLLPARLFSAHSEANFRQPPPYPDAPLQPQPHLSVHPPGCTCDGCSIGKDVGSFMNDFMNKINLLIGKHEAEKFELKKQIEGLEIDYRVKEQSLKDESDRARGVLLGQIARLELEKHDIQAQWDRTKEELKIAEKFLAKSEEAPETLIKQQLGEINEEAQFLSTEATKVVIYQAQPPPEHLRGRYPSNLIRYAGIYLAGLLEARYQNTSTAVVQLAIQALLLHLVSDAFNDGWCGPDVIGMSNVLKRTKIQPISARWRALASEAFRNRSITADLPVQRYTDLSIKEISNLLLFAAGFGETESSNVQAICKSRIGAQLNNFWTTVFDLNRIIREDIQANDYRIVSSKPGTPFSSESMELQGPVTRGQQVVLCTSGLGMERIVSTVTPNGPSPSEPAYERFLPPEVVLEQFIHTTYHTPSMVPSIPTSPGEEQPSPPQPSTS